MPHVRGGLGRGLDALIPRAPGALQEIEVDRIRPSAVQPRHRFDNETLEELAASIREHGVLQPVIVSRQGVDFSLVAGERRWRAARMAGLLTIPAVIREASTTSSLEMALVENIQRADLTPIEEAAAYRSLIDDHGLTQAEVATRVGRSRVAVANRLRLLTLPSGARDLLGAGALSEGHARALLGCDDPSMLDALAEHVVRARLSVRQTEELVRRSASRPTNLERPSADAVRGSGAADRTRGLLEALEEELQRALGTRVQLVRSRRGGRLIIYYFDDEQLTGLVDSMVGRGER